MELQTLPNTENEDFKKAWEIYEEAFPKDEQRSLTDQTEVMKRNEYKFQAIYSERKLVGLLGIWDFETFSFIEHIAMSKEERNKGYGSKTIQEHFKKTNGKYTVLESEHKEEGTMAKRRIAFYERLGMKICTQTYIQPSYGEGKKPVPLLLVAYPYETSDETFKKIRDTIHKEVYGCKEPVLTL